MIKILVCAQDPHFASDLFQAVGTAMRTKSVAFELMQSTDPDKVAEQLTRDPLRWDVLFLRTGEESGLRLAAVQRRGDLTASIIFVCPGSTPLKPLFRFRPSAVLPEAAHAADLDKALSRVCTEQLRQRRYFAVKNKDMLMRVDVRDILYFESSQRVVTLHSKKQNVVFYAKLPDVLTRLPQTMFLRCHQSYLVNISAVRALDRVNRQLKLSNGEQIEVSRSFYPQVSQRLEAVAERA